jgi:hypothetical protein
MVTKLATVSVIVSVIFLAWFTVGACDVSGQPCGLLNTSACDPLPIPSCASIGLGDGGGSAGVGGGGVGGSVGVGGAAGQGGNMSMDTSNATSATSTGAASTSAGSGAGGGDPGDPSPQNLTCMDGDEVDTYIRCRGMGPIACSAQCNAIGAYCVEYASQPYSPSAGIGSLKQCKNGLISYTCTYCYTNGDTCTFVYPGGLPLCNYTGGKGCE